METTIRAIRDDDYPFLREMLYEAVAFTPHERAMARDDLLADPSNRIYLDEPWGRPGDAGLIGANMAGQPLGAAWYRLFPAAAPGAGFVAADIPELVIATVPAARGRGLGTALLRALMDLGREQGYRALSLVMVKENQARRLYERHGFREAGVSPLDPAYITMLAPLV